MISQHELLLGLNVQFRSAFDKIKWFNNCKSK